MEGGRNPNRPQHPAPSPGPTLEPGVVPLPERQALALIAVFQQTARALRLVGDAFELAMPILRDAMAEAAERMKSKAEWRKKNP